MNQFTLFNYFLAVVALAAHYPIGKRLGIKPFFSACLTGIAFTALVVASFANIAAGLIRPYILISIAVGIGLLIYDGLRHRIHHTGSKFLLKTYLFIAIIAGIFFVLNNPAKIYFAYPDDGSVKMHYQEHYSYYASQSVEMLNARYFSRLKIANAYPYEWTTYHFFNSAAQAVVQGLIQHPTLLTYFIAQMLITLFVFLSFIEALFYLYGASTRSVIITLVWFIIGFTLFFDSIGWNAIGSGIFSIYAVIQLLFSLMSREYRKSIIFAGMLGASAFRMMPIALSIAKKYPSFITRRLLHLYSIITSRFLRLRMVNIFLIHYCLKMFFLPVGYIY